MQVEEIKDLLERYENNSCTTEEKLQVELWFLQQIVSNDWDLNEQELESSRVQTLQRLNHKIDIRRPVILKSIKWKRLIAAAAVLVVICLAIFFTQYRPDKSGVNFSASARLVSPGKNTATLILADGKQILLADADNGDLANESGSAIKKFADGRVVYVPLAHHLPQKQEEYNTIITPNAGQYQVWLPDGTKVFLNSASSLRYPATFAQMKYRKVELTGEAYFEVKKDARRPFIVISKGQKVEVLGTHFNINSYADEATTKTTLLEGSIKINESILIKPGEQASGINDRFTVKRVDAESAIDWKNGDFIFNQGEDLKAAMRKIARWYDVEVSFEPGVETAMEPRGWVSRKNNLAVVLAAIEQSTKNIHFKVEGRRVFVTK